MLSSWGTYESSTVIYMGVTVRHVMFRKEKKSRWVNKRKKKTHSLQKEWKKKNKKQTNKKPKKTKKKTKKKNNHASKRSWISELYLFRKVCSF